MANVQEAIKLLKNGNANERYEACFQLMKLSPLPAEALEALQVATKDEDTAVSSVAQKIIILHTTTTATFNSEPESQELSNKAVRDALLVHTIVSCIYILLTICSLSVNIGGLFFGLAVVGWQPVIFLVLVPVLTVGGSILFSRILINLSYIRIGYIILFSAPILVWLYLVIDTW